MMETPGGRSYREVDHRAALAAAGFTGITSYRLPLAQANVALMAERP